MDIPPKPIELCEQADFCTGEQHWRRHPGTRKWQRLSLDYKMQWHWASLSTAKALCELLDVYEGILQEKRISIET